MACKGCNCYGGCIHSKTRDIVRTHTSKGSDGRTLITWNEFVGYEDYCDLYPERYEECKKENSSKTAAWVYDNVVMDCYEPTEFQAHLDNMIELLDELAEKVKEK